MQLESARFLDPFLLVVSKLQLSHNEIQWPMKHGMFCLSIYWKQYHLRQSTPQSLLLLNIIYLHRLNKIILWIKNVNSITIRNKRIYCILGDNNGIGWIWIPQAATGTSTLSFGCFNGFTESHRQTTFVSQIWANGTARTNVYIPIWWSNKFK